MIERLGKRSAAAGRLRSVAVLQELDHDVVELDEADVESLGAVLEIGDAHRTRVHFAFARLDLLRGEQRVVNALT